MRRKGERFASIAAGLLAIFVCGCGKDTGTASGSLEGTYASLDKKTYITFLRGGSYVLGSHADDAGCGPSRGNGVEAGDYTWEPGSGAFSVTSGLDTDGDCGLSDGTKVLVVGTLLRNQDDSLQLNWRGSTTEFAPVNDTGDGIVGSFRLRDSSSKSIDALTLVTFVDASHYFLVSTGASPGIEDGCYAIDAGSNDFSIDVSSACTTASGLAAIDTNGESGFSDESEAATLARIGDDSLRYQDGSLVLIGTRVSPTIRQHEPRCGQYACP